MTGSQALESLQNLLLQTAEGLADSGEIIVFICEALKRGEVACVATIIGNFILCCQQPDSFSCFQLETSSSLG